MILLLFSSVVETEIRNNLGWVLICLCVAYVIFNTIVSVFYSAKLLCLFIKRQMMLNKHRNLQKETKPMAYKVSDDLK